MQNSVKGIKRQKRSNIRIIQLLCLSVLFLLLVPLQTPFTDPEFINPQAVIAGSNNNSTTADAGTSTGSISALSVTYSGTVSNSRDDGLLIDSSSPGLASVAIDDGWTASNLRATVSTLTMNTNDVRDGSLDSYHNEKFIHEGAYQSDNVAVPDSWTLVKSITGSGSTHPIHGTFEMNDVSGQGYSGTMGWRFDASWSSGSTVGASDQICLGQQVLSPYRDLYSAQITFNYYVSSSSNLADQVVLFARFNGYETKLHVFEPSDTTDSWLSASIAIPAAEISALTMPNSILLEVGLESNVAGSQASASDAYVFIDNIALNAVVRPFPDLIGLKVNGTAVNGGTEDSIYPYVPDVGSRDAYDYPGNGLDLDGWDWTSSSGTMSVALWGSAWSSAVEYKTGLQFPIDIPQGAVITAAYLEVEPSDGSGVIGMRISAAGENTSGQPITNFTTGLPQLQDRYDWVDTSIEWSPIRWTSAVRIRQQSPDIAPLIQRIVSDSNWISGDFACLMLSYMNTISYESYPYQVYSDLKGSTGTGTYPQDQISRLFVKYYIPQPQDTVYFMQHEKDITIDHTKVSGDLTNFPFLVDLYDSDLKTDVQPNGNDIVFKLNGQALDFQIEKFDQNYNSTHAHLVAWVKIPSLSSSVDTTITMAYGNPYAKSSSSAAVWSDYATVNHLSDDPSGTVHDSTSNNHEGTTYGTQGLASSQTGRIGDGINFDYQDQDVIGIGQVYTDDWTAVTMSIWVNMDVDRDCRAFSKSQYTASTSHILTIRIASRTFTARISTDGYGGGSYNANTTLDLGSWNLLTFTWSAASGRLIGYINGSAVIDVSHGGTSITDSVEDFTIGNTDLTNDRYLNGTLDEARLTNRVRSQAWVTTSFNNQLSPQPFISVGSESNLQSTWVNESSANALVSTLSTSPVSTDLILTMDIQGTGQSLDDSYNPGASYYAHNGTNIVDWVAHALISPPASTNTLEAEVSYPMTEWCPVAVSNPLGQNKTYGTVWDYEGGMVRIHLTSLDYWGMWTFYFESLNYLQGMQIGIDGQALGTTAAFNINDVAAFQATTPFQTDSSVGLTLTDPTGSTWYESSATNTASTSHLFSSFQYRRTITIQHSQVNETLNNFPVLLDFTLADLQTKVQPDGDDILFVDSNGNILSSQIELFDQSAGHLTAWVKANISSTVDTVLTMYYGNPIVGSQEYPDDVWSNGYDAVYHLGELAVDEATTQIYYDSTPNHYDANQDGTQGVSSGKIGYAQQFDGTNDKIVVNATDNLDPSGSVWLTGWFYLPSTHSSASATTKLIMSKMLSEDVDMHLALVGTDYVQGTAPAGSMVFKVETTAGSMYKWTQRVSWSTGWYQFAVYLDATNWANNKIYINGADNTNAGSSGGGTTGDLSYNADWGIGGGSMDTYNIASGAAYLNGRLDEVRISSGSRSIGYIRTEYANQNNPGAFISVGSENSRSSYEPTITKTMDSTAPAGVWKATMYYNDTGTFVTNKTGVYERDFIVKHDSTLTLNYPSDAVSDKTAYVVAGSTVYIEYELTDDITAGGIAGATVQMNWTVSGTPTDLTLHDLGNGVYGRTVDTNDLASAGRWRINIWSSHPYYNNATDYFDLDLYHATNMSYVDVETTPVGYDFTATLVFRDTYADTPITGATITFDNGSAVSSVDVGGGRYNITISTTGFSTGNYWYRFKAAKAGSYLEDGYVNVTFVLRKHYTAVSVSGDLLTPSGFTADLTVTITDLDTGTALGTTASVSSWTFNPTSYSDTTENPPGDFAVTLDTSSWSVGTEIVTLSVVMNGIYLSPADYQFSIVVRKHYTSVAVQGDFLTPHGYTTDVTVVLTDVDTGTTIGTTASIVSWIFNPASYSDTSESTPSDFIVNLDTSGWTVGTETVTLSVVMSGIYSNPADYSFDIQIRKHYTSVTVSGDLITPYGQSPSLVVTITDLDTGLALGSTSSVSSWTFNPASYSDTTETPPGDFSVTLDTSIWSVGTETVTLSVVMSGIYYNPSDYQFDIQIRNHRTAVSVTGQFVTPYGATTPVTVVITDLDTGLILSSVSSVTSWSFTSIYLPVTESPPLDFDVDLTTSSWAIGTETVTLSVTMTGVYNSPSAVQFDVTIRKHNTTVTVTGDLVTPSGFSTPLTVVITDTDLGTALGTTSSVTSWTFNPASYSDTTETPPGDFAVTLDTTGWAVGTETVTLSVSMSGIYASPSDYQFDIQIRKHYTAVSVTGDMVKPYGNTTAVTVVITDLDTNTVLASTSGSVTSWTFTSSYGSIPESSPTDFAVTLDTSSWSVGTVAVTLSVTMAGIYANPSSYQFNIIIASMEITVYNEPNDLIFPTGADFKITVRVNVSEPGIYYGNSLASLTQGEFAVTGYSIKEWYNLGNGRYNFTLDGASFPEGTYTITLVVSPSDSRYAADALKITFTYKPARSELSSPDRAVTTPYETDFVVTLNFTDIDRGTGITGATITPQGISIYNLQDLGGGLYRVTVSVSGLSKGEHRYNLTADKLGYEAQKISFKVVIRIAYTYAVPTVGALDIPVGDSVVFYVQYWDIDHDVAINDTAPFAVTSTWIHTPTITYISAQQRYQVTFPTFENDALVQNLIVTFNFSKGVNYQFGIFNLTVTVRTHYTDFRLVSAVEPVSYTANISISVFYGDLGTGVGVASSYISFRVWNGTDNVLSYLYNDTALGNGYYKIIVPAAQFNALGLQSFLVYFNWTGPVYTYQNKTLSAAANIVGEGSKLSLLVTAEPTPYLENMTYVLLYSALNNTGIYNLTGNVHIYVSFTGFSISPSEVDIWEIDPITDRGQYSIQFNNSIFSSIGLIYMKVYINWTQGVVPYYTNRTDTISVRILPRDTLISLQPPSQTAYGENATFSFTYDDVTGTSSTPIAYNDVVMNIHLSLSDFSLAYDSPSRTFSISFDTSQFGAIGQQSFTLSITWTGAPFYANQSGKSVSVKVTIRQTTLDFQSPAPTSYTDNVTFSVFWNDVAGAASVGIDGGTLTLYDGVTPIASQYYKVQNVGSGEYQVELSTLYKPVPGLYSLTVNITTGYFYLPTSTSTRSFSIRYRSTLVSAEPVDLVPYNSSIRVVLYYQDLLTLANIGNGTSDVTLQILTGGNWIYSSQWQGANGYYVLSIETYNNASLQIGVQYPLHVNLSYSYQSPFYRWDDITVYFELRYRESLLERSVAPTQTPYLNYSNFSVYYSDADGSYGISGAQLFVYQGTTPLVLGTEYLYTTTSIGTYKISVLTSALGAPGTHAITVYANWTSGSPYHSNATLGVSIPVIQRVTNVEVVTPPSQTNYLENVTFIVSFVDVGSGSILGATKSLIQVWNGGSQLASNDFSFSQIGATQTYEININSTILSGVLVQNQNLTVRVDWPYSGNYYRDDSSSTRYTLIPRATYVSVERAANTAYGENATFTFSFIDSTIVPEVTIPNSASLIISTNLGQAPSLTYSSGTRVFTMVFNTSQFGGIGLQSFTLSIRWAGSPYYANKTSQTVYVTIVMRQSQVDFQTPDPTPYGDYVNFTVTYLDIAGASSYGIADSTLALYYLGSVIPGTYYDVTPDNHGAYEIRFDSGYFTQPGKYGINATLTYTGTYHVQDASAVRTLNVRLRTTILSADPVASVGYGTSLAITLHFQDQLTLGNIGSATTLQILNNTGVSWVYSITWNAPLSQYDLSIDTTGQPFSVGISYTLHLNMSYAYQAPFYRWDDVYVQFSIRSRTTALDVFEGAQPTSYNEYIQFIMYYWDVDVSAGITTNTIFQVENETQLLPSADFTFVHISNGYYLISVNSSSLCTLSTHELRVTALWTGGAPFRNNAHQNITVRVIERTTEVEIVSPPSSTPYLDNVTFTFKYTDTISKTSITVTSSDIRLYANGTLLNPGEFVLNSVAGAFEVQVNSTVLSTKIVTSFNITIVIDWNSAVAPYYRDATTALKVTTGTRLLFVEVGTIDTVTVLDNMTIGFSVSDDAKGTPVSDAIFLFSCETAPLSQSDYTIIRGTGANAGKYTITFRADSIVFGLSDIGEFKFDLTIQWNPSQIPYYRNRSTIVLTGSVDLAFTSLQSDLPTPSPVQITGNTSMLVYFKDLDHNKNISGASIGVTYLGGALNGVVPQGLSFFEQSPGIYNVSFSTKDLASTGSYVLNITAAVYPYETGYVTPTLTVSVIQTSLTTLEDTVEVYYLDSASVTVSLNNLLYGTFEHGATITYSWPGGTGTLSDLGNGSYTVSIDTSLAPSGTQVVKFTATKSQFAKAVATVTLIVLSVPTDMTPIDPTEQVLALPRGSPVPMTIYLNDTLHLLPITGANITAVFEGKSFVLTGNGTAGYYTGFIDGNYTELPVTFYTIRISAHKDNYDPAGYSFKIDLQQTLTNLDVVNPLNKLGEKKVSFVYSENITFVMDFTQLVSGITINETDVFFWEISELGGISGNFAYNSSTGLWESVFNTKNGAFGTYGVTFIAIPTNPVLAQNSTTLTLTITKIRTQVTNPILPTFVWGWVGNISFTYNDTYFNTTVPSAELHVTWGSISERNYFDLGNGTYLVPINTTTLTPGASWSVVVDFDKENYETGQGTTQIAVVNIPTELVVTSPEQNQIDSNPLSLQVPMGDSVTVYVFYNDTDNTEGYVGGIAGGYLDSDSYFNGPTRAGPSNFTLTRYGNGTYSFFFDTLDPELYNTTGGHPVIVDGWYTYLVRMHLENHVLSYQLIRIRIVQVQTGIVKANTQSSISLVHGDVMTFDFYYNDTWHNRGVDYANFTVTSQSAVISITSTESLGGGWYRAAILAAQVGGSVVTINIGLQFHTNVTASYIVTVSMNDTDLLFQNSIYYGLPIAFLIIALLIGYVRVWSVPKRIRQINGQIKAIRKGKVPKAVDDVKSRQQLVADLYNDSNKGVIPARTADMMPMESVPVNIPEMGELLIQLSILTHLNPDELDEFKADISKMKLSEQAVFVKEVIDQEAIRAARRDGITMEEVLEKTSLEAKQRLRGGEAVEGITKATTEEEPILLLPEEEPEVEEPTIGEAETPESIKKDLAKEIRTEEHVSITEKLSDYEIEELRKELQAKGVQAHEIDTIIEQARELPRDLVDELLKSLDLNHD